MLGARFVQAAPCIPSILQIPPNNYLQQQALRLQTASVSHPPGAARTYKAVSRFNPPSVVDPIWLTELRDVDERPLPLSGATNINDCDSVAKAKQWITYQRCEPGPSTMNRTWNSSILRPKSQSAYAHHGVSYVEAGKLTITSSLVLSPVWCLSCGVGHAVRYPGRTSLKTRSSTCREDTVK